jgi:ATP/maltotriose-dependent transcriptional regulator MalT
MARAPAGGLPVLLARGRDAFARRDWLEARDAFQAARELGGLAASDLYSLADAAWWLGLIDEFIAAAEDAYTLFLREDDNRHAASTAMAIAYTLSLRGEEARASGWMNRGLRLLEGLPECPEHGYLLYMDLEGAVAASDVDRAIGLAREIAEMGRRFDDPNLRALALLGEGRALLKGGDVARGMALLDEAMLAAVSDDLDPSWAGNIYCHLILACYELADLKRAGEWTEATMRWCESMPGAGPFMGICRVHRAQVLQARGEWSKAEREAARVCRELEHFHVSIVAEAYYQLGEVRRQRGDLAGAEQAFRQAHERGRDPQPGLALLRLAQGRVDAAMASLDAALGVEHDRLARARLCAAMVEVALAAARFDTARAAAAELAETARTYGTSGLQAPALHARGAVLAADEKAAEAVPVLRAAFRCWQELSAPYDAARVRLLLAEALERLGDADSAALERDAAAAAFAALRATGDAGAGPRRIPGGLTPRELEVLLHAARGLSNSDIADALVISIRTVERHLATAYQKLGFGGRNARAAAISFVLREGMLES